MKNIVIIVLLFSLSVLTYSIAFSQGGEQIGKTEFILSQAYFGSLLTLGDVDLSNPRVALANSPQFVPLGNGIREEVIPFGGVLFNTSEAIYLVGARLGFRVKPNFNIEGSFGVNGDDGILSFLFSGNIAYHFYPNVTNISPFVIVGAGALVTSSGPADVDLNTLADFIFGIGINVYLTDRIALRPEYRGNVFVGNGETEYVSEASGGISFGF